MSSGRSGSVLRRRSSASSLLRISALWGFPSASDRQFSISVRYFFSIMGIRGSIIALMMIVSSSSMMTGYIFPCTQVVYAR